MADTSGDRWAAAVETSDPKDHQSIAFERREKLDFLTDLHNHKRCEDEVHREEMAVSSARPRRRSYNSSGSV